MGGGAGKPLNIFKFKHLKGDDPKEVINWKLWFAVFSFGKQHFKGKELQLITKLGIMGAARGIDEGLISGTFNQKNFQELLGFDKLDKVALADLKGNVSAMVVSATTHNDLS